MAEPIELVIRRIEDMDRLNDIAPFITEVSFKRIQDAIELPRLPVHVTTISMHHVKIRGPVVFSEGLQVLMLRDITFEVPLLHWQFPSTLKEISVADWTAGDLDLRSATAPSISCQDAIQGGLLLLPEGLDKLRVSSTEEVEFPPYLRELSINGNHGQLTQALPSVTKLTINNRSTTVDLETQFPNLEFLRYASYNEATLGDIEMDSLRELEILYPNYGMSYGMLRPKMILPRLETLTLMSSGARKEIHFDHPDSTLGDTVRTLILNYVPSFPKIAREWEQLETLDVRGVKADFELPFIRWLEELIVSCPVITNGRQVSNIDEYKQAWGLNVRKKGAQRSATGHETS